MKKKSTFQYIKLAVFDIILLSGFITPIYAGQKPAARLTSVDPKTAALNYELTVPAWVRIRVGIADGPLYRCLINWKKQEAGTYTKTWDGFDSSGTSKLAGRNDLGVTFNYFTEGTELLANLQGADIQNSKEDNLVGRHMPDLEVNRMHKSHKKELCSDITAFFSFPDTVKKDSSGFYIIEKEIPLTIDLEPVAKNHFRKERFSLHVFLDDVFAQGELDGYLPYTYMFNPKGLNPGKHLILVNLAGFEDHYAIASIPVIVKDALHN